MLTEEKQSEYLRRLRFPAPLERQFREEHAALVLRYRRISLVAWILVNGTLAVGAVAEAHWERALLYCCWVLPIGGATLLASVYPASRKHLDAILAFALLFLMTGSELWARQTGAFDASDPTATVARSTQVCLEIVGTYTVHRLRFLPATGLGWARVFVRLLVGGHPPDLGILLSNLIGMLSTYSAEHSARKDFLGRRLLAAERDRSESLVLNVLPRSIAQRLKAGESAVADSFPEVTVLFADLVDFTELAAKMPPREVLRLLNTIFSRFDRLAEEWGLEKIKTIGDAYMVVGGLPDARPDHAEAVTGMAIAMLAELEQIAEETGQPLRMRIGIHSGPVVAGVIGTHKLAYDLWGDTVNLASRMESLGLPGRVQVSRTTRDRLQERYSFLTRPAVEVKGHGLVDLYVLETTGGGDRDPCTFTNSILMVEGPRSEDRRSPVHPSLKPRASRMVSHPAPRAIGDTTDRGCRDWWGAGRPVWTPRRCGPGGRRA